MVALYAKYNNNKGWARSEQTSDPAKLEDLENQAVKLQTSPLKSNKTSASTGSNSDRIFDMTKEYVNQNGVALCEQV